MQQRQITLESRDFPVFMWIWSCLLPRSLHEKYARILLRDALERDADQISAWQSCYQSDYEFMGTAFGWRTVRYTFSRTELRIRPKD
jgi:hypothetical protein